MFAARQTLAYANARMVGWMQRSAFFASAGTMEHIVSHSHFYMAAVIRRCNEGTSLHLVVQIYHPNIPE
jgi:hypothetical protein